MKILFVKFRQILVVKESSHSENHLLPDVKFVYYEIKLKQRNMIQNHRNTYKSTFDAGILRIFPKK